MEGKDFFRRFSRRRRMEKDTAGQPRAIGPTGPRNSRLPSGGKSHAPEAEREETPS